MKTMNMKKTVLAGVMAGAALYAFSFTAVPGNVQKMTRVQAEETAFTGSGEYNGILYENGEPFTGVKARKKGFKKLKSYTGDKKKYKYYFNEDGSLSTNLFKDWGYNKCIKSKMTIEINTKTHNLTFYLYDKKSKKYIIPAKTVICSTSAKSNGTPRGHFFLMKTSAKIWVHVPNNTTRKYQWAVRIAGTPTLIHSSVYRQYGNNKSLIADYYNTLGSSNTSYCVRLQAVNAKIVYDVATKTNTKERVWVNIVKNNNKGPFGVVKLKDSTGKLKSSRKTDPTDPALFPTNPFSVDE